MSDTPTNPEHRARLKGMIVEITRCLELIDAQKEQMKDIAQNAEDEFSIKKTLVTKVARTMYKQNFESLQHENSVFEDLYEVIAEGKKISITADEKALLDDIVEV